MSDARLNEEWRERAARDPDPCPAPFPRPKIPVGFTNKGAAGHPTYKHYLEDYGTCELTEGHDGPHKGGSLIWHDPEVWV